MAKSPEELAHLEWLGYVQPVGLVVSIPALLEAQCYVNKNIMGEHARFLGCLASDASGDVVPEVSDLSLFTQQALDWQPQDLVEVPKSGALSGDMAALEVILPQYNETLRPTHVVVDSQPTKADNQPLTTHNYLLLVQDLGSGVALDDPSESDSAKHWNAPPHAKFERLLRESGVPIGLLTNRRQFRLVYAPRGETSGYATFNVGEMAQVAGRPMFAAFQMLLGGDRLFNLADNQRLPHILANSRKYQNIVSTELAQQVTSALFEMLRGFQAANDQRSGELLRRVLANNPQHVYHGLLTVLMRLVFVLYAEDRGLVSSEATYTNHYSVSGLFERLRSEAGRFPDTMDQRFGAWAQLLTLFRLVYEGGQHAELKIPARKGYLFDPDRYPFLEGRYDDGNVDVTSDEEQSSAIQIPHISDGVIYRVLEDLLILDGERLSYRTLDVEQIGSVYEAIMGFELQVSAGKSIAVKPVKSHGAPATINLEALLAAKAGDRAKLLKEWTDQKLGAGDESALKSATSIEELLAAMEKKIAKHVTPGIVPADSMVFQPSDERRRSGSHYTPRSLTQPIVKTTLEPILKQLITHPDELNHGGTEAQSADADSSSACLRASVVHPRPIPKELQKRLTKGEIAERERIENRRAAHHTAAIEKGIPHPSQILDLKVCDPAMGSGAFLVEACRQLGDELIKAWYAHDMIPTDIPPDEDEVLYARRTVAQRCLYGVDKNIMAVDLAKLSLWLVTLAKDHPFTFLDHALRHGDTLVGLTREQIIGFHWEPKKQKKFGEDLIQKRLDKATESRAKILNARQDVTYRDQQQQMALADSALDLIRLVGNACVSCFFAADKKKAREEELERVFGLASSYLSSLATNNQQLTTPLDFHSRAALQAAADRLKAGQHPVPCFHWEIEFPEVFSRDNGGFDAFVGNPPFFWGNRISHAYGTSYRDWLMETSENALGNADLVTYFLRVSFGCSRINGATGLITTNSIAETDTRESGLGYVAKKGGHIFAARRDFEWPGEAGVRISCIHFTKGNASISCKLDGSRVEEIGTDLREKSGRFAKFDGPPKVLRSNANVAFKGVDFGGVGFLLSECEYEEIVKKFDNEMQFVWPVLNAQDFASIVDGIPKQCIINFMDADLETASAATRCFEIVRERVKPMREMKKGKEKEFWWQFRRTGESNQIATQRLSRVLICPVVAKHLTFAFYPRRVVFTNAVNIFAFEDTASFAILQSQVHSIWALRHASTLRTDTRYNPTDCFETFPLPLGFQQDIDLRDSGDNLYLVRQHQMLSRVEGLTTTYNRFHNPDDHDLGILELRHLHGEMDVAVLRAYDWDDLADQAAQPDFCQFLLDYEEDEDEEVGSSQSSVGSTRQKKKPWRYRWPDDFRDEVLARLLELNEQRHKEELLVGSSQLLDKQTGKKPKASTKRKKDTSPALFEDDP